MKDVIINDTKKLEIIKENIRKDGLGKLQVLSDFDKTLTACFTDGKKIVSLISILRDEHYLTPDYSAKAQALYDRYHPLEISPDLNKEEKNKLMHEWWKTHYDLLIESGLTKDDLKKVVTSKKISFRQGAEEFLDFLKSHDIPLVILSAAGVGSETISLYLEKHKKLSDNIFIVSNEFIWGNDDRAIGVKEPIIHSLNKNYSTISQKPFFPKIKERKNIILLGDGLLDANMAEGFDYDNIIKIGFLNEDAKGELTNYQEKYDIIILNDGPMDYILNSFRKAFDVIIFDDGPMNYVNSLLKELASASR